MNFGDYHVELTVPSDHVVASTGTLSNAKSVLTSQQRRRYEHAKSEYDQPVLIDPVVIEDDVWIGMHCTLLPGVTIGRGAVVGAGSLVTNDLPPGMICYGSPCKPVRARPNQSIIQ